MSGFLLAEGASLLQTGIGAYNMWKGRQEYNSLMRKAPKYSFEMPSEMQSATNVAAGGYYGSNYGQFEQSALSAGSSAMGQVQKYATSSQDVLGSVQDIYAKELGQLNQISLNEIDRKETARQAYIQSLQQEGQMAAQGKQQEFEYNKWLPWQMQLNAAASKAGSGQQMMYQGIGQGIGVAANYMQGQNQLKQLAMMYGQDNSGGASVSQGISGYNSVSQGISGYNMNDPKTWGWLPKLDYSGNSFTKIPI